MAGDYLNVFIYFISVSGQTHSVFKCYILPPSQQDRGDPGTVGATAVNKLPVIEATTA